VNAIVREELASFLRSRRARVQPGDVGLTSGSRRRTPGLRREEVAQLADVGVSWYTWLEQGRDIQVSEPFLERLSRALRLTPTERAHLFELASGRPAPRPVLAPATVSPALQRVLDAHPYPALAATMRWDVLAWNQPAALLYGDFGDGRPELRNGVWRMFMSPASRAQLPDWARAARNTVARFRLDAARAADRAPFDALVAELSRVSPEFVRLWGENDVVELTEGAKQIIHPVAGAIVFDHVALAHREPDGRELRVTLYAPKPGEDEKRARRLFAVKR
jgi:transcriptional regulator with XRE-family HTH domain